ncbi:MAG: M16 family metallopeptidase [Bacteroidales bacterium]
MSVDRARLPLPGPDPAFTFPRIVSHRLANGLEVRTVEHRGLPVIAVIALVPAGGASDPDDRPGLAALTGDMLDEGAGGRSAIALQEELGRIGASLDTEVGADATMITLAMLSRFTERGLALLADILVRPSLDEREFGRLRELRVNRLKQLRDVPASLADRAFSRLLFGDHPYAHLPMGTEGALVAMTHDEVCRFHRAAYDPRRATLIAVGDAPHDDLARSVERAFSDWTPGSEADGTKPIPAAVGPVGGPRVALVARPGAPQSELRIGQVGAHRTSEDYHALLVLNALLGGQFVSRINMNLREHKGYTYGARTTFDFRRGRGPFLLQTSVQTQVTAAAVRESFNELSAIRGARPASPSEVDLARASLTRGFPRNFETSEQVARAAAQLALYDLPPDSFERFVPTVNAIREDEVTRVAQAYLQPDEMITVVVGDPDIVVPSLVAEGFAEPAIVTVE